MIKLTCMDILSPCIILPPSIISGMTAYQFFCQAGICIELLPDLCDFKSNHTKTRPECCVGGVPVLVAMLTQYSEAGVGAFNILYEITYREHLPADHVETVEGLLVRLRAPHRMCHVLAACLPPVQGGSMVITGTDGEPIHPFIHPFIMELWSVCLSVHVSVCPSVRPSVRPSMHPSIHPSIHPVTLLFTMMLLCL